MGNLTSLFRNQLIFDEQRSLFDYWQSKCTDTSLPSRNDISPLDFIQLLPMVSLIEIEGDAPNRTFTYRLAGTGLRSYFNQEITGKMVDALHSHKTTNYWRRILDVLATRSRPACGAINPNDIHDTSYVQFWMKLPLVDKNGRVKMILSYDRYTTLSALSTSNRAMVVTA